ncbi:hypothetical protein [Rhodococcus sp. T2V]|uniref:hypothetical protein n=1 Tax=Rhodococcus sp. T2V TaxID=3034164 RepID=UPI0034E23294
MWTGSVARGDLGVQLITLGVLVAVFAVATWRSVHVSALALALAAELVVGTTIAENRSTRSCRACRSISFCCCSESRCLFGIARSNGFICEPPAGSRPVAYRPGILT